MRKKIIYLFVLIATIMMFTVSCIEQTYLVEFDTAGGTDIVSQVVNYDTLVQKPTDPYKENHKFLGWYLGEEEFNFNTPINGNLLLTAKWEVVCYNVVFDTDGGSEVETLKVGPGSFVRVPENPTKDKYAFAGWYLGEEEFDFSTPVTSDITLVAKWENAKYLVSFDTDGGSAIDAQKVEINNFVTKPEDPTKEGFAFAGWYLDGEEFNFETPIETEITLAAKWVYKLQLNEVVGTWSGDETMSGMSMATYELVINPDGSGKASYNMSGYQMDLAVSKFIVEDYQLVMEYSNNGNPSKVKFSYEDGKLVSNGIVSGEYGQLVLMPKDLVVEDIAATWEGVEVYSGMEIPYTVLINLDGSVEASFDMFGMVSELTCVVINNKLVLSYMGLELVFAYDGTKFVGVGAMGSTLVLEQKKEDLTLDALVGTWQGVEETAYGNYTYEITLKADGTGEGSYVDEAGLYPSGLEITEVVVNGNEVVMTYLSYAMEYTMTFTYEDGKLVTSQGAMWGSLTLEKTITLNDVAGTWVSSEEFYGMAIEYTFVINPDGTGSAKYSTSYGDTIMTVEAYKIVDGKLVLEYNVDGYEYDPLTFEFTNGTLVGTSPMATTITLTKTLSVSDLAGTWQGVEETAYGNYTYEITLKADGTGEGSYVDEAGLYPSDLEITEVVVNGNEVVMTYLSYAMEYTMTFTYEDGKLVTSQGAMWGSLTLEK